MMKGKAKLSRAAWKRFIPLYVMLILPVSYFLLFKYGPMYGISAAFKDYNIFKGLRGSKWVGFKYFKELFTTPGFFSALKNTLMDRGYAERTSDMNNIRVSFDFGKANYVQNQVSSAPNVPEEFFAAKYDIVRDSSRLYHNSAIPGTLSTDVYLSGLQTLICEFALKVISAPAGQFDKVWDASYAKLVENHLEDVLNERAAWYDANRK